jgi:uncharacterized membrane protein YbhN (UPF0104 family)
MWPLLRWFVGLALLGIAADVVSSHQGELSGLGTVLDHLRWWWLIPALLAEAASELSFVAVQSHLLRAGGLRPRLAPLAGMTLASQAMTNSVPGGPAVAAVYGFRWYRRLGADDTLAGWALVGTTVVAALSLALLAGVGLGFATGEGASLDLVPPVLGVLVVTAALGVLFVYERPLAWFARWALHASHRLIGRPRGDREAHVVRLLERVAVVRLRSPQALATLGWGFCNWLFDCTCFAFAFLATGSSVPLKGLLLAYGAGQLAANLPITPGGLGAVEGSITIALAYFGGGTAGDIAAVLVYRVISFWLVLAVGWSSWGALALAVRGGRYSRSARAAPVEPRVIEVEEQGLHEAALRAGEGEGPRLEPPSAAAEPEGLDLVARSAEPGATADGAGSGGKCVAQGVDREVERRERGR